MALAYLQLIDKTESNYRLLMDAGTSMYFEFVIGKEVANRNGAQFVDDIKKRTSIKKVPVSNPLRTDIEITLSASNFEDESRFIQLFTYSTPDGRGASFSDVVEVRPRLITRNKHIDLPDIQMPKFFSMSSSYQIPGRVSQSFSESKLSEAMFFASLMPMLTKILPMAGNLLGGASGGGGALGNILPLLSSLLGGLAGGAGSGAENKTGGAGGGGINMTELLKPETIQAFKGLIDQFTQKEKLSGQKSVSTNGSPVLPNVSPALLQLSPVIAPILEKMISPEAIAAVGSNPQKLYAAIADGIAHLPIKDVMTIKKLLAKTQPTEYVKSKPNTNYSQPMFWQALLSLVTPDMVNAVGNQANNTMKTAQEGILNLKKEQARFVEALIPKGDVNQPIIKDMIGAISQYNLLTHQPTPQQAVGQSIGSFANSLCQIVPALESSLSDDSIINDAQEQTKELADKIQNQFLKLQEDIKKKMLKTMKDKIEEQVDNIDIKSFSLQFSDNRNYENGSKIFNNGKQKRFTDSAARAFCKLMPIAFAHEFKHSSSILENGKHKHVLPSQCNDPAVSLMLQKIDDAVTAARQTISFKHDDRFSLDITGSKTVSVNGVPKVLYVAQKGVRFAVTIQAKTRADAVIPKCVIQVQIKGNNEKNILVDKKFQLINVNTGSVLDSLFFTPDEIKRLPANTDLLVCFTLVWKDKNGHVKGGRKCHSIMITEGYLFNGLNKVLKAGIPLNNITEHRDFWHKVWENKTSVNRKKSHIDCKYYIQFDTNAVQNSHIETKTLLRKGKEVSESEYEADDDFIKIKSGLQISPSALNALIPKISKYPALNETQLNAVKTNDVKKIMDCAAIDHLEFKSLSGEANMLWVYPEVDLCEISFKKPNNVNAYGNVLDLSEEKAAFIKPAVLHFIGTKN